MITLRRARSPQASATPRMSRSTAAKSPDLSAPTWMTMSISVAPWAIACRVSATLVSVVVAPRGKPTTVHTDTPVAANNSDAVATWTGFRQTLANWKRAASRQSCATCS